MEDVDSVKELEDEDSIKEVEELLQESTNVILGLKVGRIKNCQSKMKESEIF